MIDGCRRLTYGRDTEQRHFHMKRQTPLSSLLILLGRNSPLPDFLPFSQLFRFLSNTGGG